MYSLFLLSEHFERMNKVKNPGKRLSAQRLTIVFFNTFLCFLFRPSSGHDFQSGLHYLNFPFIS